MKKVQYIDSIRNNVKGKRERLFNAYKFKVYLWKFAPIIFIFMFTNINIFLKLLFALAYYMLYTVFFDHLDIYSFKPGINIWFGVPGAGKTSMAALLSRASRKLGYKVLSNVKLEGTYKLEISDLGEYDMSFGGDGCHTILDESSLAFDNRLYNDFVKTKGPVYFSMIRHMYNRGDLFSQGYDIDKRIRDRCSESGLYYLKRSALKGFVFYRHISKVLIIEKENKQIIDGFEFKGLPHFVYSRSVWNSFDTYDLDLCPKKQKEWKLWDEASSDDELTARIYMQNRI